MENAKKSIKLVNMKAFRVANDLSQKEVAEYLDVSIAFISAVERGQAKLPAEKLAKLLENDREWETSPLVEQKAGGTRIHNDHRTIDRIGQNFEGDFLAPVNNYNGYSEEEFQAELKHQTEIKDIQIKALEDQIASLRIQLAREISNNDRLMSMLEGKGVPTAPRFEELEISEELPRD